MSLVPREFDPERTVMAPELKVIESNTAYLVSSDGHVYSTMPWRGTERRELTQETHRQGYKIVTLSQPRKRHLVHVLVGEAFLPSRPKGQEIRHLDGNPANNDISNLAWGTRQDNLEDARRHDTLCVGSRSPNALLNEESVVEIRSLIKQGYTQREIAEMYDVTKACIANVATRSWKHVRS